MAKIKIEITGSKEDIGTKHLPGSFMSDTSTLCGHASWSAEFKETEGIPNCVGCIDQAKIVFASITKKELKSL